MNRKPERRGPVELALTWLARSPWWATLTMAGCLAGFLSSCGPSPTQTRLPLGEGQAVVLAVVDGDTIKIEIDGRSEIVRLLGIDAPESVHPKVPVQCYGPEASDALRELLPEHTVVRVERDTEARDRYGRLLLYIYRLDDELFINHWLVENGFADTASYEPNTTLQASFTTARATAIADQSGLWRGCDGPDQPLS